MCQVKLAVVGFIKHKTLALIFKSFFHDGEKQKNGMSPLACILFY